MAEDTKGPWALIERADGKQLSVILSASVGATIYAFFQGIIEMMQTAFDLYIAPLAAMIDGVVTMVTTLYEGYSAVIEQGTTTAVQSIAPGATWAIGPFTQALSIGIVIVGIYVVARAIAAPWTSNLVPGILVDNRIVSFFGETPEEEEDRD